MISTVHHRLKKIEQRLAERGAEPVYTKKQVKHLDDIQAEMALRAETDRLALLVKLEAEQATTVSRRGWRA